MVKDPKSSNHSDHCLACAEHIATLESRIATLESRLAQTSTHADKRSTVAVALRDRMRSKLSDREIARQCGVSHPFVLKLRRELGLSRGPARLVTRGGTTYKMETGAIGTKQKRNRLRTKIRAA